MGVAGLPSAETTHSLHLWALTFPYAKMGATWSLSVLFVLLILATSCVAQSVGEPYIDLTSYFTLSASSACGDPPTLFESPKNSGQFQSCNGSHFSAENAVDGNFSTRWQSANGESPVNISLTLDQVCMENIERGRENCLFLLFPAAGSLAAFDKYSTGGRLGCAAVPAPGGAPRGRAVLHGSVHVRPQHLGRLRRNSPLRASYTGRGIGRKTDLKQVVFRFHNGAYFFLQTVANGVVIVFGPGTFSEVYT